MIWILFFSSLSTFASDLILTPIKIETDEIKASSIFPSELSPSRSATSDSASLLKNVSGVNLKSAGGVSSLPVIHGLADDRINIKIDGASITSSCSNHMNPAMSYVDPDKIEVIDVYAGISPVSHGGDSIGGSIIVKSKTPDFSENNEKFLQKLYLKTYFRTNNENKGGSVDYHFATENVAFSYSGMGEEANNYRNGNGERLHATLYNQNNHSITLAKKMKDDVVSLKLSRAKVPYQAFVNQYMDMEDNTSNLVNLNYKGALGEFIVDSTFFYQNTDHYMDKINSQRAGKMPMYSEAQEFGYNVKFDFELSGNQLLRFGSDFSSYRLNDWWPPVAGAAPGMGPGTFQSIHHGKRDRLGLFIENESRWSSALSSSLGVRTDIVSMDTDNVKGYSSTNSDTDANYFNSLSKDKVDHNYDATLAGKYKLNATSSFELALARKTRSPNLYERYAWAGLKTVPPPPMGGPIAMDMRMINWFGDGNGYVGNIDLKPEVANKIAATFNLHDVNSKQYELKFTPFYSEIKNFIDADLISTVANRNYLQFANHDAVIFGADFSLWTKLVSHSFLGEFSLKTSANYTRGYRKDGKSDLYHLMPLNGQILLIHNYKKWTNDLALNLVNKKEQVNDLRMEPETAGYALVDVGTSYQFTKKLKLDFGITNLFDHQYGMALGGIDVVNHSYQNHVAVAGMGRSYNFALTINFL